MVFFFFFQAEDGIRDADVTGVQTCALPISPRPAREGSPQDLRQRDGGRFGPGWLGRRLPNRREPWGAGLGERASAQPDVFLVLVAEVLEGRGDRRDRAVC